ncbi:unnamed protein product [Chrysoparadoxa australica]
MKVTPLLLQLLLALSGAQAFLLPAKTHVSIKPLMAALTYPVNRSSPVGVGDIIEAGAANIVYVDDAGERVKSDAAALFAGKKVCVFAVPGAFTPTCSEKHLPGFVAQAEALRAKGVDIICCMSVNDAFVLKAWGQERGATGITMVADGNGELSAALGLLTDKSGSGMGARSKRFAMVLNDNKVDWIAVDEKGLAASSAEQVLEHLGG